MPSGKMNRKALEQQLVGESNDCSGVFPAALGHRENSFKGFIFGHPDDHGAEPNFLDIFS
jgi:hypothetical protein